jgi:hypothetical protein
VRRPFFFVIFTPFYSTFMNKSKSKRRSKRTSRPRQSGFKDGSYTHTMAATYSTAAASGAASQTVLWSELTLMLEASVLFQYVQPISYRIRVFPQVDTVGMSGYAAFVPRNPLTNYTGGTVIPEVVTEIRGNVALYPGFKGDGAWCKWPYPNIGLETYFVISGSNKLGTLLAYTTASSPTLVWEVQVTARFSRRQIYQTTSLLRELKVKEKDVDPVPIKEISADVSILGQEESKE